MNRHILLDRLMLLSFRLFGQPFFADSIEATPFQEHIDALALEPFTIDGTGYREIEATTLAGRVNVQFHVLHYARPDARLLVYNMGGSESPFDKTLKKVYPLKDAVDLNVVAVEAPWQRSVRELSKAFTRLDTYVAMIATAVRMTERILQDRAFRAAGATIVSGTSLGGFVTNRHHMTYDTADAYVPFVAGTRHGDIFLTTIDASEHARANPEQIRACLNFDTAWHERAHPNVFPQLSRFDQLNRLEAQGPAYGSVPIDIWEGGHLYNVLHPHRMRHKFTHVFELIEAGRV